eukprot:359159-Chlamydomonas_euryale.AAC.5
MGAGGQPSGGGGAHAAGQGHVAAVAAVALQVGAGPESSGGAHAAGRGLKAAAALQTCSWPSYKVGQYVALQLDASSALQAYIGRLHVRNGADSCPAPERAGAPSALSEYEQTHSDHAYDWHMCERICACAKAGRKERSGSVRAC